MSDAGELSPGLLEAYMLRFELTKEQVLEQKAAFDLLDLDRNGEIKFEEVKAMNAKLEQPMSDKELEEQFGVLDIDGSGRVTFSEFLKVYVKGEFGRDVRLDLVHDVGAVADGPLMLRKSTTREPQLPCIEEARMVMKMSQENGVGFYARAAKKIMQGSEERPPPEELELQALGKAITNATAVAAILEREGMGHVTGLQTDLRKVPGTERHCPLLSIRITRSGSPSPKANTR